MTCVVLHDVRPSRAGGAGGLPRRVDCKRNRDSAEFCVNLVIPSAFLFVCEGATSAEVPSRRFMVVTNYVIT